MKLNGRLNKLEAIVAPSPRAISKCHRVVIDVGCSIDGVLDRYGRHRIAAGDLIISRSVVSPGH